MTRPEHRRIDGETPDSLAEGPPSPSLEDVVRVLDLELAATGRGPAADTERHDAALMIRFAVGDAQFAVAAEQMVEIDNVPAITPVPRVPRVVSGLANLRGEIIPVLDLASLLGIRQAADAPRAGRRMIVVRDAGRGGAGGILVDRILGISPYLRETLRAPASFDASEPVAPYLVGAVEADGEELAVIDLEAFARAASSGAATPSKAETV